MDKTRLSAFLPARGARGTGRSIALLGALLFSPCVRGEEGPPVKPISVSPADPAPAARPRAPGGIVAIVNDDVITQAELDLATRRERSGYDRAYSPAVVDRELPRIQRLILDRMVESRLVLQLVKKAEEKEGKPYVTEADIDKAITDEWENYKSRGLKISTLEEFLRFWRETYGAERDELRKYIKDLLAVRFYLQRNVFTPHGFVPPTEMRNYYQQHLKEFKTPVAISFRQITIPRTHAQAEPIVAEVEKGLRQGVDFCELAEKFDQEALRGDPESTCRLWTKTFEELNKWHEPLRVALRSMEKGKISPRVLTPVGIHFLKVEEVIEGTPKPFSEVQEEITLRIRIARNEEEMNEFFGRLKKKSRIEKYLPSLPVESTAPPRSPPPSDDAARGNVPGNEPPPREGGGGR